MNLIKRTMRLSGIKSFSINPGEDNIVIEFLVEKLEEKEEKVNTETKSDK